MKIVHVCLAGSYNDNWGYQDNIIPKYHQKDGHDVTVITSVFKDRTDTIGYRKVNPGKYYLDNGIKIIRIPFLKFPFPRIVEKLRIYKGLYMNLKQESPDLIFIHGIQFLDMKKILRYLKDINSESVRVVADNHSDFSNSAKNWFSKNVLHKIIWRYTANIIEPYCDKYYGVLPARVDFLTDIYKVPKRKTSLLVMGADDEYVEISKQKEMIQALREKHKIQQDDFLIVTGGKIDNSKKQVLLLMQAVKQIQAKGKKVKLIVFGSIIDELKEEVNRLIDDDVIKYIGWVQSEDSYKYFGAADLVVFPGRHSVFWEQVVALGIPLTVKHWEGTTHIDIGGNVKFLYEDSVEEIKRLLETLLNNTEVYFKMKEAAQGYKHKQFLYSEIAKKSLSICERGSSS